MTARLQEAPCSVQRAAHDHVIRELPVLVILPHSRCNCRCVMCDIWKIRQIREVTAADLEPHIASLRELKVRWVVFSGGEPLMHSDLSALAQVLRRESIRTTLLTAGLTLARHAESVARDFDDVIVSLDGPREVHDHIRGLPNAYGRLERGIHALREIRPSMLIQARSTVQKNNHRYLHSTVSAARELGLDSISFLAADTFTDAFNHSVSSSEAAAAPVALDSAEVEDLAVEVERLIVECREEIESRFIRERPEKLRRVVQHFRASLGQVQPVAPRCNAPWVSAVIESDGAIRPCFFHKAFGNIRDGALSDVLNSATAVEFRRQLDIAENHTCQRCVCSLYMER